MSGDDGHIRRRELSSGFELEHEDGRLVVHELAPGVILQEYEDGVIDDYFEPVAHIANQRVAEGHRITLVSDITRSRSHTPEYRRAWSAWISEHAAQVDAVLVLLRSPMQRMAVNAANKATGGAFQAFTDVEAFQAAVEHAVLAAEQSGRLEQSSRLEHSGQLEPSDSWLAGKARALGGRTTTVRLTTTARGSEGGGELAGSDPAGSAPTQDESLSGEPVAGTILAGAYQIHARIGRGGMGTVYRARQLSLQRDVAVKLIRLDRRSNPETFARFRREIDVVAHLSHANIVQIIDAGATEDGQSYLVMELLEGKSLLDYVPVGGLAIDEVVNLFGQLCAGVRAAHASKLIHRDLTPGNAFVCRCQDGSQQLKILDFGLAKSSESGQSMLTMEGQILGTPSFMAPEQIDHEHPIDERTDVYALGALLFYMLTGRRPFGGKSPAAMFVKQLAGEHRPLPKDKPALASFRAVIDKALAVEQDRRYSSVDALWDAVQVAGEGAQRRRGWRLRDFFAGRK